jgi:magnesium transporter
MVTYFYKTLKDKEVRTLAGFQTGCYVSVVDPTDEELVRLSREYDLDIGHLRDALDPDEVPRFETEETVHYIITRVPVTEEDAVLTIPLMIVIHERFILTLSSRPLELFDPLFSGKVSFSTTQRIKFFIQMFSLITERYNFMLTTINRRIYTASRRTERFTSKHVIELVNYEYIINGFLSGMVRTNAVLNTMLTGRTLTLYKEDRELVEDLFLATGQLIELLKSSLMNVRNIREAYSTIMTNNLNRIIKFFTALTIILTIPTIIFSMYGMNVGLPFDDHQYAFQIVLGLTCGVSLALFIYFSRKDWI